MTTEERLDQLEKELALTKLRSRRLLQVVVGLSAGVCLLALVWAVTGTARTAQAQDKRAIRANEFVLEDDKGRTRSTLRMFNDQPMLALLDENEKSRVELRLTKDGPGLVLLDKNWRVRATLGAGGAATPDGKTISYPESSLRLANPDGRVIWQAP